MISYSISWSKMFWKRGLQMFSQFSNSLAECSEIFLNIMCKIEICVVTAQESGPFMVTGLGSVKLDKRVLRKYSKLKKEISRSWTGKLCTRIFKISVLWIPVSGYSFSRCFIICLFWCGGARLLCPFLDTIFRILLVFCSIGSIRFAIFLS